MSKQKSARRKVARESGRGRTIAYALVAFLALAGLADATYLTVQALTGETALCNGASGCFKVLGSSYARIGNVPLASLGVVAYFTVFCCGILAAFKYSYAPRIFAWVVSVMFATTLWLLYVQAFVLHAFCRYCLFSAAVTFLLAGIAVATPAKS